jgi:hypothetical protein
MYGSTRNRDGVHAVTPRQLRNSSYTHFTGRTDQKTHFLFFVESTYEESYNLRARLTRATAGTQQEMTNYTWVPVHKFKNAVLNAVSQPNFNWRNPITVQWRSVRRPNERHSATLFRMIGRHFKEAAAQQILRGLPEQ